MSCVVARKELGRNNWRPSSARLGLVELVPAPAAEQQALLQVTTQRLVVSEEKFDIRHRRRNADSYSDLRADPIGYRCDRRWIPAAQHVLQHRQLFDAIGVELLAR